ncbi:MFS transporter [Noviherbaspirillum galbum]|uniref:Multidrug effflux MFS transporter n=1 Tax=Noviherbaspirillum galbum TaxID=2709383 RepID=A0A6B3SVS2_9BURK|nr:MFS transporter [Noviherbaspirillum galbum]NEX64628.1 multidrug effflux MFS transporter [Noviherbaspirillum galbum]
MKPARHAVPPSAAAPGGALQGILPAIALVLLFACQPIATDLYLPALPRLAQEFEVTASRVQTTFTVYLFGFALAHLALGWLPDRLGQRKVLLHALALYALASAVSATSGQLSILLACRTVQGVATALSVICARSVIRMFFTPDQGPGIMAKSLTGMALIAMASPLIGGVIVTSLGWGATFLAQSCFGVLAWLTVYLSIQGTGPRPAAKAGVPASAILRNRQFLFSSLLAGASFSSVLCFLLLSPFIFIRQFHLSAWAYGWIPACCSLFFFLGTVLCRRRLHRYPLERVIKAGAWLTVAGATCHAAFWLAGWSNPWTILFAQCLFMLGHGTHQPCGQAGAVLPFRENAGRAAGFSGFVITTSAFLATQAAASSAFASISTLVLATCIGAGIVASLAWYALPRAIMASGRGKD